MVSEELIIHSQRNGDYNNYAKDDHNAEKEIGSLDEKELIKSLSNMKEEVNI